MTLGIAADLAHPLDNATGISLMLAENNSKRLELLREIKPESRRIAVLANPLHPGEHLERNDLEAKARQLGLEIAYFTTPDRETLDRAIAALDSERPDGVLLFSDGFMVENRHRIIAFKCPPHPGRVGLGGHGGKRRPLHLRTAAVEILSARRVTSLIASCMARRRRNCRSSSPPY